MPTLADIRKQYPQYDSLTDAQLASALYEKFYKDKLPRTEFNAAIGFGSSKPGFEVEWRSRGAPVPRVSRDRRYDLKTDAFSEPKPEPLRQPAYVSDAEQSGAELAQLRKDLEAEAQARGVQRLKQTRVSEAKMESTPEGSFTRHLFGGAFPTVAGLAGGGALGFLGSAAGLGAGPAAPIASPTLGMTGAITGGTLASAAAKEAQDKFLREHAPLAVQRFFGADPEQEALDQKEHPYAAFAGDLATQGLAMRPDLERTGKYAFRLKRLAPTVLGGLFGGGTETWRQITDNEDPDLARIAMATGAGAAFSTPNRLGRVFFGTPDTRLEHEIRNTKPDPAQVRGTLEGLRDSGIEPSPLAILPARTSEMPMRLAATHSLDAAKLLDKYAEEVTGVSTTPGKPVDDAKSVGRAARGITDDIVSEDPRTAAEARGEIDAQTQAAQDALRPGVTMGEGSTAIANRLMADWRAEKARADQLYADARAKGVATLQRKGEPGRPETAAPDRDEAFHALANAQRGEPEAAMLRAQRAPEAGPSYNALTWAMEHIGDLTHRMAEPYASETTNMGQEFVAPKVKRGLDLLNNEVDAARIEALPQTKEMTDYADAHAKLPVYNEAQRAARDAAVALGRRDLPEARRNLEILKGMIDNGTYADEAAKYTSPEKPAVPRDATPEYEDTRGQGVQYHGARGPVEKLEEGYYSPDNIYGGYDTLYTTDATDIAKGYGRKNPNQMMYEITERKPVKFYDMEEPKGQEDWDALFGVDERSNGPEGEAIEAAIKDNGGKANLRQVMDEIRAISREYGYSKNDVQDIFDGVAQNLKKQGFGGMTHIGGLRTKRPPHTVKIYFDPHEQVDLKPATPRKYIDPTDKSVTTPRDTAWSPMTPAQVEEFGKEGWINSRTSEILSPDEYRDMQRARDPGPELAAHLRDAISGFASRPEDIKGTLNLLGKVDLKSSIDSGDLFGLRDSLGDIERNFSGTPDAAAAGKARRALDDFIHSADAEGRFTGDPEVVSANRAAIANWRDFRNRYPENSILGKLTAREWRGGAEEPVINPDEAHKTILGNVTEGGDRLRNLTELRDRLGEDSPEWKQLRQEAIDKVIGSGDKVDAAARIDKWATANPKMAELILGPEGSRAVSSAKTELADAAERGGAMDMGTGFFNAHPKDFSAAISGLSGRARRDAIVAARNAIRDNLKTSDGAATFLSALESNAPAMENLRSLLGPAEIDDFRRKATALTNYAATGRRVTNLQGPRTAGVQQPDYAAAQIAGHAFAGTLERVSAPLVRFFESRGMSKGDALKMTKDALDPSKTDGIMAYVEKTYGRNAAQAFASRAREAVASNLGATLGTRSGAQYGVTNKPDVDRSSKTDQPEDVDFTKLPDDQLKADENIFSGASDEDLGLKPQASGGGASVGDRNNNPGNLKAFEWTRGQPGYVGANGEFAVFATREQGEAAQEKLLRDKYLAKGYDTIDEIVEKYAPKKENTPAQRKAYKAFLSQRLGLGLHTRIPPERVGELAEAKRMFETGGR